VSASQTSMVYQTNNIQTNEINGDSRFSYMHATYAPNGRYFWAHGVNATGIIGSGYIQMVIASGGYWGFQIKNPHPGNSSLISISVEQINRGIGGTMSLENIPFGYEYSTQGFG